MPAAPVVPKNGLALSRVMGSIPSHPTLPFPRGRLSMTPSCHPFVPFYLARAHVLSRAHSPHTAQPRGGAALPRGGSGTASGRVRHHVGVGGAGAFARLCAFCGELFGCLFRLSSRVRPCLSPCMAKPPAACLHFSKYWNINIPPLHAPNFGHRSMPHP